MIMAAPPYSAEREAIMANVTKMTERKAWEAVLKLEGVTDELKAFAEGRLAKLDEKNEKRKTSEKALAKAAADETLATAVLAVLGEAGKAVTSADVVAALKAKGVEVTSNKVASLGAKLVAEGKATVKKDRAKGREVNFWALA